MHALATRLTSLGTPFTELTSKTAWPYLLTGLALAAVLWAVRRRRSRSSGC